MKTEISVFIAGLAAGAMALWGLNSAGIINNSSPAESRSDVSDEPLYWVAPMDPDYRRDGPGKSPMGMDLVPVYNEDTEGDSQEDAAGTVRVSPALAQSFDVRTDKVVKGHLKTELSTVGYAEYDDDYVVHIHPRTEGWIEKLHVRSEGDPVKQGAALYDIYSPTLVNAQEEYLLALRRGNNKLIAASRARLSALQVPDNVVQAIKQQGRVQQTMTMRAPQSGIVDQLNIRQGMYVVPGTEILTLAQAAKVWVVADVFVADLAFLKGGETAQIQSDSAPAERWNGVVDYIYPTIDDDTRTAQVRIRIISESGRSESSLRPGMYTRIAIQPATEEALLVPRDAVIRVDRQNRVVLKTGSGKYRSVPVKTGRSDDEFTEILRGLHAGDEVVTSAQFMIDSESAKKADLNRFENEMVGAEQKSVLPTAMVDGVINRLDKKARVANISRGPIEKWNRPAATIDFRFSDEVNLSDLNQGDSIHFVFKVDQGEFTVISVHPPMTGDMDEAAGMNKGHDHD